MKNILIIILTQALSTTILLYAMQQLINLHSVHPEFGNYVKNIKIDSELQICEPWDYCPPSISK